MATALINATLAGCGNAETGEAESAATAETAVEEETPVDGGGETLEEVAVDAETEQEEEEKYLCMTTTDYNADGSVETLTKYIYNEYGNTLKATSYAADSSIESLAEYEYEYDDKGNTIKYTSTETDADGNVTSSQLFEYEYDDNGNIIWESDAVNDVRWNEPWTNWFEYEYDDNGNKIKEIRTNADADRNVTDSSLVEYEYDDNGNEIKHTYTTSDADGNVTWTNWVENEYEYDDSGNIIKYTSTEIDADGNVMSSSSEEYEYDDHGNITKKSTSYNSDYYSNSDLSEYEYDADDRLVKETNYSYSADGVIERVEYSGYDEYGNRIISIYYSTYGLQITEYKYIEQKDYLASKGSIDGEEIEIVNSELIENILSSLGIISQAKVLNIDLMGDPKSHVSEVAFRTAPYAEWTIVTPTGTTPVTPMSDSDRDLFYIGTLENYSLPGDYLEIRVRAVLNNGQRDNTEYIWIEDGRLSNVPSGSDCKILFDHIAQGIFVNYYNNGELIGEYSRTSATILRERND